MKEKEGGIKRWLKRGGEKGQSRERPKREPRKWVGGYSPGSSRTFYSEGLQTFIRRQKIKRRREQVEVYKGTGISEKGSWECMNYQCARYLGIVSVSAFVRG